MRYPDGGGLSASGRAKREKVRLRAARMFEQGIKPVQVARALRVSTKSAYQWRRRWRAGGEAALESEGPGGSVCRLNPAQLDRLAAALEEGPAAHGYRVVHARCRRAQPRWKSSSVVGSAARAALMIVGSLGAAGPKWFRKRNWFPGWQKRQPVDPADPAQDAGTPGAAGWRWPRIAALLVVLAAWPEMLAACGTPGHRPPSMPASVRVDAGIGHDPALGLIYPGSVTVGGRVPGKAADHASPETTPSFAPPGCQFKCPPPVSQDAASAARTLVAPVPAREVLGWYLRKLTGYGWRFAGLHSYLTPEIGGATTIELARPPHADLSVTVYSTLLGSSLEDTTATAARDLASWHRQFTVYHLLLSECSECRYDAVVPRSLPPPGEIADRACGQPQLPAAVQLSGSVTGQSGVTCDTLRDAAEMDSSSTGHSCQQIADALQRFPGTLIKLPFQVADQDFSWDHNPGFRDQLISSGPYTSDGLLYQSAGSQPLPVAIGGGVLRVRGQFTGSELDNRSLGGNPVITVQISAPCTSLDAPLRNNP